MAFLHPRLLARIKAAPIRLSGWGMAALQRLILRADGDILRADGDILRIPGSGFEEIPVPTTPVLILWEDVSELEDGFRVEMSLTEDGTYAVVATTESNVTSATVEQPFNTGRWYRVLAFRTGFPDSDALGPELFYSMPTASPVFTVTQTEDGVLLAWTGAEAPVHGGYRVSRRISGGPTWEILDSVTGLEFLDADYSPSTQYEYLLEAYNISPSGVISAADGTTGTILTPGGIVTATALADGDSVEVEFSGAVAIGSSLASGFEIQVPGDIWRPLAYVSGNGSATLLFSVEDPLYVSEELVLRYVVPVEGGVTTGGLPVDARGTYEVQNLSEAIDYLISDDLDSVSIPAGWAADGGGGGTWGHTATLLTGYARNYYSTNNFSTSPSVGARPVLYAHLKYSRISNPSSAARFPLVIIDESGLECLKVQHGNNNVFGLMWHAQGSATLGPSAASTGVEYYIWLEYIHPTVGNSDGIARLFFATTPVKPATAEITLTGRPAVNGMPNRIRLGSTTSGTGNRIHNKLRLAATPIGSNPL